MNSITADQVRNLHLLTHLQQRLFKIFVRIQEVAFEGEDSLNFRIFDYENYGDDLIQTIKTFGFEVSNPVRSDLGYTIWEISWK